jgi:hypothetical protein
LTSLHDVVTSSNRRSLNSFPKLIATTPCRRCQTGEKDPNGDALESC